ncbi:S1/P1 Nuclease [Zhouia amylolytica]|uniref:S1/P1 Nuclease n=1 Tax=Zhouia amylolytica TaxID=376730 RepID=A0A1I6UWX8_9FLAO|nr:S1/P1 nuclease [Zhouia amylolytica]SFT05942.1 S1/P1 Nuclease [Zhouia amylolytica]
MKRLLLLLVLSSQFCLAETSIWGSTGHRVVGEVATEYLKGSTKRKLNLLLDSQSLALVSTFGDDIKSDKRYKEFNPWHYVNIPSGGLYDSHDASAHGDIIQGIEKCIAVIQQKEATKDDKAFYLKMLVHLIGDLHQPLHVGRAEDKGGNDIQVRWFNKGTNLHRVWDSDMINHYKMSYSELAENLPKLSRKERKAIEEGTILDWTYESQKLADKVYATADSGAKLGYGYMYENFSQVRYQLLKGGIRLAKVLNAIL